MDGFFEFEIIHFEFGERNLGGVVGAGTGAVVGFLAVEIETSAKVVDKAGAALGAGAVRGGGLTVEVDRFFEGESVDTFDDFAAGGLLFDIVGNIVVVEILKIVGRFVGWGKSVIIGNIDGGSVGVKDVALGGVGVGAEGGVGAGKHKASKKTGSFKTNKAPMTHIVESVTGAGAA